MPNVLAGGLVVNLEANSAPTSNIEMFREVERELTPYYRVRLDERRFREIEISGAGWTNTQDYIQNSIAIRVTRGRATFQSNLHNNYNVRQDLSVGNWLYLPKCSGFSMTSGKAAGDYPCTFVVASMPIQ